MHPIIFLFIFCLSTPLFGQTEGHEDETSENSNDLLPPSVNKSDEIPTEDQDNDPELQLSSSEIRDDLNYTLGMGLGAYEAWQKLGFQSTLAINNRMHIALTLGSGTWNFRETYEGRDYKIKIVPKGASVGGRYFFWDSFPFFYQISAGYAFWQFESQPTGVVGEDDDVSAKLRFSGNANGPWIAQSLGFQILWASTFGVEVMLFGVEKSFVVSNSISSHASWSRSIARKRIEGVQSWGLLNVKFLKVF